MEECSRIYQERRMYTKDYKDKNMLGEDGNRQKVVYVTIHIDVTIYKDITIYKELFFLRLLINLLNNLLINPS